MSRAAPSPALTRPLIGIEAYPATNETWTLDAIMARRRQAIAESGISFLYVGPTWKELEPRPGAYDFSMVKMLSGLAVQHDFPIACNIHLINTVSREMPQDLEGLSFKDPRVRDRFLALLDALVPCFQGRLRWCAIGNEIDTYFGSHAGEIDDYAHLLRAASLRLKERVPGIQVSTAIQFSEILSRGGQAAPNSEEAPLQAVLDLCDYITLTYYPLNPDFSVYPSERVAEDWQRMRAFAKEKPILFQEIGCPSSPLNGSSQEKQAAFFREVFDQIERSGQGVIAANFMLMFDWPQSLVDSFGGYYGLPNVEAFKGFLQTLGVFDEHARPKASWAVFCERSLRLKAGRPESI